MPDKYRIDKLPSGGTQYMKKGSTSHKAAKQFHSGGGDRGSKASVRTYMGDKFQAQGKLGSKSGVHRAGTATIRESSKRKKSPSNGRSKLTIPK